MQRILHRTCSAPLTAITFSFNGRKGRPRVQGVRLPELMMKFSAKSFYCDCVTHQIYIIVGERLITTLAVTTTSTILLLGHFCAKLKATMPSFSGFGLPASVSTTPNLLYTKDKFLLQTHFLYQPVQVRYTVLDWL